MIILGATFGIFAVLTFLNIEEMSETTGFLTCIPNKTPEELCEKEELYKNWIFATAPTFTIMRLFRKKLLRLINANT